MLPVPAHRFGGKDWSGHAREAFHSTGMIVRKRAGTVEAISQHAHSWLSAHLGRHWAWENPLGPVDSPLVEEFLLGVAEHDLGYLDWAEAPPLDPSTQLPYNFLAMPPDQHLANWRRGIEQVAGTSPLASLMVSRHACLIYEEHHDHQHCSVEEQERIEAFIAEQKQAQRAWTDWLIQDPAYAILADEGVQVQMSHLLRVLDLVSLLIAMDVAGPENTPPVPGCPAGEGQGLVFRRVAENQYTLSPWPLTVQRLPCQLAMRTLARQYNDQTSFLAAWQDTKPSTWKFVLTQGD